jgi:hypothetical protein
VRAIEKKLVKEFLDLDISEKVEGSTHWVFPIQIVPKKTKDWHLVVDMHRANASNSKGTLPSANN